MLSDDSKRLLALEQWLKPPAVSCALSRWVFDLLPTDETTKRLLGKSALLLGCDRAPDVSVGQVSYIIHGAIIMATTIKGPRAAVAIDQFGKDICVVSKASILRTAIMLGLRLPRVEFGIMSATRVKPLTDFEVADIIDRAKQKYPEEF